MHTRSGRRSWIPPVLCALLVLGVFWRAVCGGVFFFGDIYRLHLPLRSAYADALQRSSLPLWTQHVMAGFPLLAEGELGALYPPNLILHLLLPVPLALNLFILGHFVLAALGGYAFARQLRLLPASSLCTGLVYGLGGFMVAHLDHVNIVAVAAWMPWLFLLTERVVSTDLSIHRRRDLTTLAAVVGLQFLAGHVQIALLSVLATTAYGLFLACSIHSEGHRLYGFVSALVLGTALAAAQLFPSYELTQLSVRSGGLDPAYFASFSLHPLYLSSLLWPFVLGNPYPNVSVELVAYTGWLPLLLALGATVSALRKAHRLGQQLKRTCFFAGMAAMGVALALGRWNPLYMMLARMPVFNLFRVPSRYLLWFSFAVAVLAGLGLDRLLRSAADSSDGAEGHPSWLAIAGAAVLALLISSTVRDADQLVHAWRWLPVPLGLVSLAWLGWSRHRRSQLRPASGTFALVLVMVDLVAFNSVFSLTYNQTMPLDQLTEPPRSLSFLREQEGSFRIYTSEDIVPVLSVMRESYYPNLALIHGLDSANGLFPLPLSRYTEYVGHMTPRMLDLLGVRFYVIPQLLPVDEASEFYDLEDPFTLNPVGCTVPIEPRRVEAIDVESYISHSVDWPDGQAVADILLHGAEGGLERITIRAGWHTSEWAYDRSDVAPIVSHQQAPIARSWPARSGFPPEDHLGHTYRASFRLRVPLTVEAVEVQPSVPRAYMRIERLLLHDSDGGTQSLAHLAGMGEHTLAYRSEDAAMYLNHDAMPRAFIVHDARSVRDDSTALGLLTDGGFNPGTVVLLETDDALSNPSSKVVEDSVQVTIDEPNRVVAQVDTSEEGYLVLCDTWYPGWRAQVDGNDEPVLRADLLFRAVHVGAGEHMVQFTYEPGSWKVGLLVSASALALLVVFAASGGLFPSVLRRLRH